MKQIDYGAMYPLCKDGRYHANYKDKDGKWHSIADKDAENLHKRLMAITDPQPPTLSEIAEYWKDIAYPDLRDGTISCYDPAYKRVIEYAGNEIAHTITPQFIKRQLTQLRDLNYSAKTIKMQLTVWRLIYRTAIQNDKYYQFIKDNPAEKVTLPNNMKKAVKREAPEDEIVDEIRRTADTSYFGHFALFLMATGFRFGEALAVQMKHIDWKSMRIVCNEQITFRKGVKRQPPKTDAGIREVPILPDIEPWIKKVYKKSKPDEYLFHGDDPMKPLPYATYKRRWLHYCIDHGWVTDEPQEKISKQGKHYVVHHYKPTITAHVLRHGYATLLFEAKVDVFTAMTYMGHSDVSVTQETYEHLRERQKLLSENKLVTYVQAEINRTQTAPQSPN